MRPSARLLVVAAEVANVANAWCWAVVLIPKRFFPIFSTTAAGQLMLLAIAVILPAVGAKLWATRKLAADYPSRQARAVATGVAVFIPLSMAISNVLAPFLEYFPVLPLQSTQNRFEFFSLLFALIMAMTAVLSYAGCLLVLWTTRRIEKAEQYGSP